jgi:hypothetical protein
MTREEKIKRLAELKEIKKVAEQELELSAQSKDEMSKVDPLAMKSDLTEYPSVLMARGKDLLTNPETQKDFAATFPGFAAGGKVAVDYVNRVPGIQNLPKLPKLAVQGLAGLAGGLYGSEVTGPHVKPYTDAIYDTLTDPRNVLSLGDDFKQGVGSGAPSVIDNTLVPYETVDSSSTGVMNYAPQLR